MVLQQNPQVQFRRINGRIVPIKIRDGTPNPKPAKTAEQKARQLTKKIERDGLFGNKYFNPQTIGISVLAGLGVVGGLKATTLAIKKAGPKVYGPKGFSGLERYITNTTNLRNRAAKQAYNLSVDSKQGFFELEKLGKAKNLFDYAKQEDLFRKAKFLSQQAAFKQQQAAKLTQNITRTKNQTGYRFTKPVVEWWKNNEAKIYAGVGTAGAVSAYVDQTRDKKRR